MPRKRRNARCFSETNRKQSNPMNSTLRFLMTTALITAGFGTALAQAPDIGSMDIVTRSIPDGPVALVGKTPIDRIDFVLLYRAKLARFAARYDKKIMDVTESDRVGLGIQCIQELIEQELLYQHALEQKMTVDKDEVKKESQEKYETVQQNLSEAAGREVTEAEVLDRLEYTSRADIEAEIERAMLITKLREKIVRDHVATLTPEELERIYEKNVDKLVRPDTVNLKQIFIRADEKDQNARAAAEKKANEALGRIFSGQRFEAVAESYSDIPEKTDMGDVPLGQLPPYFTEPLAQMKTGEISDVIGSSFGYHIIMLVGAQEGDKMDKDTAEKIIKQQKALQEGGTVIRDYCAKLMEEGKNVTVFLELQRNMMLLNGSESTEN